MESSIAASAIAIAVTDECSKQWRDVLLDIEEEGIPFVLQPRTGSNLVHRTWQTAQRPPLLVGITCDRGRLIVYYKNLPAPTPLFPPRYHQDRLARRNTGNNAARPVKGIPFRDRNAQSTGGHNINNALGLVETKGLVGAIEAVDAMVKPADVRLIGYEKTSSGLITVMIRGDIGTVKAAVDAGSAAVSMVGEVKSSHMTPCPHSDVEAILPKSV